RIRMGSAGCSRCSWRVACRPVMRGIEMSRIARHDPIFEASDKWGPYLMSPALAFGVTSHAEGRPAARPPAASQDRKRGAAMSVSGIDEAKLETFMGRAVTDMGAIISAPLMMIGERLGLYKAMAHAGPLTAAEVAERAGASERYVREWLGNQAAGGYVIYDPDSELYTLPDGHALALADEDSPFYILGVYDS